MSKNGSVSKTENTNATSNVIPLHASKGCGRPSSIFVGYREILQSSCDAEAW